jgi:hypothetical protein
MPGLWELINVVSELNALSHDGIGVSTKFKPHVEKKSNSYKDANVVVYEEQLLAPF